MTPATQQREPISIRLDSGILAALDAAAAAAGLTRTEAIRVAISDYVRKQP